MAEWLNDWAREFAATHDDVLSTATFFPEPSAAAYVDGAIEGGARLFKAHLQVGGYDPRHPWLDPVWGSLTDAGIPVVVHAGAGPRPGAFTGPGPFGEVLARHPRLVAVVAHMGWPDVDDFLDLADRYDEVRLDTTMSFVDVWGFEASLEESRRLAPRLAALRDKVLLGTDFPNIPYDYAHQLAVLARLDLGDDWLRAVCWENAVQLLRLDLPSVS
jgi:predicted TIM-barrel fold metal-dependent hydrolase